MSFTFNENLVSDRDVARFLVQDTDPEDFILHDEQITVVLAGQTNKYKAAAALCRVISANYSKQLDITDEDAKLEMTEKAENYRKLAIDYDKQGDAQIKAGDGDGDGSTDPVTDAGLINLTSFLPKGRKLFSRDMHKY